MKRRLLMTFLMISFISLMSFSVAFMQSRKAPNFTFSDLSGQQHTLASIKGKVAIIDLWATWCGPCKKEIPSFVKLKNQYGDKIAIIGLAYDDEVTAVKDYLKSDATGKSINYPIVFGTSLQKQPFGQPDALPTTYIIDKQGNVRKEHVGFMSFEELHSHVEKLLAE